MIRLIFFDAEGKGPCAARNNHEAYEWGAVDFSSWLQYAQSDRWEPGRDGDFRRFHGRNATRNNIVAFDDWISQSGDPGDRFVMVTDNPAYDWQHINYYMHHFLGRNILGHSARRIGDFALGMLAGVQLQKGGDLQLGLRAFLARQDWKKLRITKHTHHPVDDALGNVEAFAQLLGWKPPTQGRLL